MSKRITGVVERFNAIKGYGFITDGSDVEYFVHFTKIVSDGYKSLEVGTKVTFLPETSEKGMKALDVEIMQD